MSNGCKFVQPDGNLFAPASVVEKCYGNTGEQRIEERSGAIGALKIGASAEWTIPGHSDTDRLTTIRCCEAVDTVRGTAPAGSFDTYKMVCEDV